MKGIYLTEEGKKEIEDKISELQKRKESLFESRKEFFKKLENSEFINDFLMQNTQAYSRILFEIDFYKEVISSATILPMDNWGNVKDMLDINTLPTSYKNGVVIQPKQ
jgi:hypothetical protein